MRGTMLLRTVGALAACVLMLPVLAGEGRTPVFEAGAVLAVDGKYILTRNLIGPGPVLAICSPYVDLDLNGFLVMETSYSGPAIGIGSFYCPNSVVPESVTIRNGTLFGGSPGISAPNLVRQLSIEAVKISFAQDRGILLGDALGVVIRHVEIAECNGGGILWAASGGNGSLHGTIEDNLIRSVTEAVVIQGACSSVAVLNNRIRDVGGPASPGGIGISLSTCDGSLVSGNTVENAYVDGIRLYQCARSTVSGNVVSRCGGNGIHLEFGTSDTLVSKNTSSGNGTASLGSGGSGILATGSQNVIQDNVLNTNAGVGLHLCGTACGNTFGGNTARGNGGFIPPACGPCVAFGAGAGPPNACNTAVSCAVPNSSRGENLIPGPPLF